MHRSSHHCFRKLLLLLSCFSIIIASQIEIPFLIYKGKSIYANITIGTPNKSIPPQSFAIELDTGSSFFWIREYNDDLFHPNYDTGFISNLSSTFTNRTFFSELRLIYGSVTGFEAEDHMALGHLFLPNYPFILANNTKFATDIDGIMGLGLTNETNHLLSFLYSTQLITQRVFSFNMKTNMMSIGSIPAEIQKDLKHFSYCRVINEKKKEGIPKWKCMLTGVYVQGNTTNFLRNEHSIEFNTGTSLIIVNFSLLYGLFLHFITNYQHGICVLKSETRFYEVNCSKELNISNFTDLSLHIDRMTITIPKEDLFIETANSYVFLMKTIANYDTWIIGYPLLKYFHSVFDMDKGIVGLHSQKNILNEYDSEKDEIMKAYKNANRSGVYLLLTMSIITCLLGAIINGTNKLITKDIPLLEFY